MCRHYIYTLTDPRDGVVRYVGQSKNKRYADWFRVKSDWEFQYGVRSWLWSLKKEGKEPVVNIVIEGLNQKQANAWETGLIDFIGRRWKHTGPLCNIANGGAGTCGVKRSVESNRKTIVSRGDNTLEATVAKARAMAEANGGKLQNSRWLQDNGHKDIVSAMHYHSSAFIGVEQFRKHNLLEVTVAKARAMAEANGGKLQNSRWLRRNGHWDVVNAIRTHLEAFVNIEQIRK